VDANGLGPAGGKGGGNVVFEGTPEELVKCEDSLTGKATARQTFRGTEQGFYPKSDVGSPFLRINENHLLPQQNRPEYQAQKTFRTSSIL